MRKLFIIATLLLLALIPIYNYCVQNNDILQLTAKYPSSAQSSNQEIQDQSKLEPLNLTTTIVGEEVQLYPITDSQKTPSPATKLNNEAITAVNQIDKTITAANPANVNVAEVKSAPEIILVGEEDVLAPEPEIPTESLDFAVLQSKMLGYINYEREKANLTPLVLDNKLCEGATLKSNDLGINSYFSHTSPIYGSPFEMMTSQGILYRAAAENIAKNTSVDGAHTAFMNSIRHKANILNQEYSKAGLGFYQKGQYLYVTQWFTD